MLKQNLINWAKKIIPFGIRILLRKLNWGIRYALLRLKNSDHKTKVYCPIADKEFVGFVKLGRQMITPSNGALGRQRLVWHYLVHEIGLLKQKRRILHTAPEYAFYSILKKATHIDYFTGDKMVEGYSNQPGIHHLDLTALNFKDHSFDLIISNHVLEHIIEDKKAMSEMYRVLDDNGMAIITVPINDQLEQTYEDPSIVKAEDRKKAFGQWDHVRYYGLDIKKRLERVGFVVEIIPYAERFSKEDVKRFGFTKEYIIKALKLASTNG